MSDDSGEKNFAPTEKRVADAAKKGDVLRSKDAGTAAVMLVGATWLVFAGPYLMQGLSGLARDAFLFDSDAIRHFDAGRLGIAALFVTIPAVLSLAVPVILVTLISQLGLGRGRWVGENLAFKGSRINPLSGLKRMFGMQGLMEIGKGLLKVTVLGAIAYAWWQNSASELAGLGRGNLAGQLSLAWSSITSLVFSLAAGLVVIAMIDFPLQWIQQQKRLKMSFQDMRDENKESEGSPEMKAARRQRQHDIAMGSVSAAMREAQFVITNPTHFAIALSYDPEKASAPVVLAKGKGDKALAMKQLAREFEVPTLELPQLARSLFFTTRERQIICEDLYSAVAWVLAHVMSLKRGENPPLPVIDVPAALRFDADGRLGG